MGTHSANLAAENNGVTHQNDSLIAKRRAAFVVTLSTIVIGILGIWLYNQTIANKPLQRVLTSDARNSVVRAHAHFDGWYDINTLTFDIDDVSKDATRLDVLRAFLQYADSMKGRPFKKVILSCRGQRKFQMEGSYFQQLGIEFQTQNPLYTIRTLPLNVTAMDGSHPYSEYEGGLLGALSAEMQQFADFSDRWYGIQLFQGKTGTK